MQQYPEREEEEQLVEDILSNRNKKKINSKKKGNRVELEFSKIMNKRFKGGFSRSIGSGNRWGQNVYLPKHALDVYSADLVVPENFKFSLEVKGGYDGIDLNSILSRGNSDLNKFLIQSFRDAEKCNKRPLLAWKRKRKPWLVFVLKKDVEGLDFTYSINYNQWIGLDLEQFIKLNDEFFFNK